MLNYNAPADGVQSTIDGPGSSQVYTFMWLKKSILTARKEQYFTPLANVTQMPKNMGKQIKVYEYVPLLDDRNVNNQGLDAAGAAYANGNLYGSSRDVGTITGRLPVLGENGGRVNRVGFTRLERTGSLHSFGFFMEFTKDSMQFDSDDTLMDKLSTELMNGAVQISEATLQLDLLAGAGTIVYSGIAAQNSDITGEGATPSVVTFATLSRLDSLLTENRTPKNTTVITGSRFVDTRTVASARYLFVGQELTPLLKTIKDPFNMKAFIPVQQYGDAGTVINGEIGSIDNFRIIEVPEMFHWAGVGAAATNANPGYRTTVVGGTAHYDVYPMLVVGDDSFTTIGFQTDGKSVKVNILTKMPGLETAHAGTDPYGQTGFSSIQWYYGSLIKRPERLGLIKTVAPV